MEGSSSLGGKPTINADLTGAAADELAAARQPDPSGAAGGDPPAMSMQEVYPRSEEEPEENEPESLIKMEESMSVEEADHQKSDQAEMETEEKSPVKKEETADVNAEDTTVPTLGGKIESQAFCLLDGIFEVCRNLVCDGVDSFVPFLSIFFGNSRKMGIENESPFP